MAFTLDRILRRWLVSGCVLFGGTQAPAAVYDLALNDARGRSLRLNIPTLGPRCAAS